MAQTTNVPQDSATRVRWGLVLVAFCAVLIDGFDTATMAASVPTLAEEWGLSPAEFTTPLVTTNIGVVLGYLLCGTLGALIGRKRLLLLGVVGSGVLTLLTATVLLFESMSLLAVVRLVTGIALGIVLPVAVSLTTDHVPEKYRQRISVAVTLGLASGMATGGVFGGLLIEWLGSGGMFWVGGVAPLLLVYPIARMFGEPEMAGGKESAKQDAKVIRLFDRGIRINTTFLWAFSFLIFLSAYTLTNWVPTLLIDYGFSASEAPMGLAFVSFGGVLGGLVLILLTARIGITWSLVVMPLIGITSMLVMGLTEPTYALIFVLLLGAGAGTTSGQIGQLTMAVTIYPRGTQTTGVGWSAALGRMGSIVGPGVAGILISLAFAAEQIILFAAVPVVIATACAFVLALRRQSDGPLPTDPGTHAPSQENNDVHTGR